MSEPLASWRRPRLTPAEPRVISDIEQRRAQTLAVVLAVDCEKFILGRLPKRPSFAMFRLAVTCQDDPPLASVLSPGLKRDITIPNERPQVVADRRTIGNERARQLGQRRRGAEAAEFGQNCILGRSEPARLERVIIELSEPARCFARRADETLARAIAGLRRLRHWLAPSLRLVTIASRLRDRDARSVGGGLSRTNGTPRAEKNGHMPILK